MTFNPANEAELAAIVTEANGRMNIRGGGTRVPFGTQADVLDLSGLSGVTLYEPGALTLVAQAGTPVSVIKDTLAAEGQRLAFEPMDHCDLLGTNGASTIGGVFAANISGPRRIQVGAARDFLLGVRFVDGVGQVVSNGGRVMKNVTGYDLVKLMAGSYGTLGVLSEVSLKVLAVPETEATLVCYGQDSRSAVQSLSSALGTAFDITGAAFMDASATGSESRTQIRLEGFEDSVKYRAGRLLSDAVSGFELVTGDASASLWSEVRDVTPFSGGATPVWRVSVKPTDAPILTDALKAKGLEFAAIYDWGGGLIWLDVRNGLHADDVRAEADALGGHATLIRAGSEGSAGVPRFHPRPAALQAIEVGLRAKFDPKGVFNPGLMD